METKVNGLLRTILDNTPGMGYLEIFNDQETFENEQKILWDWFHVSINESIGLKSGTYIYVYESLFNYNFPEADHDLVVSDCEEEHIKLYYMGISHIVYM